MLFYSMTIQNVQQIVMGEEDEIPPSEYANSMVETVENLIVKIELFCNELQLPSDSKINGEIINDFKEYTFNYFNLSPNAFLEENHLFN